ncbi:MAG TPA: RpiB/LacA/LacB family sugar-phosphate isomerase [Bacteroidia bacterium]|jgi:ribose 5-phosphate isomerase B|nr:RpiB/LacA/LacB family sugar-phosphate isomerase [Bacteroidia bacterium]
MTNATDKIHPVGIAADHGGFELKEYLIKILREAGYEIIDFGNTELVPSDDYPDYIIPLAKAISNGTVSRGIAICGSGVGACIAANKIVGVRACLIHEKFSAQQGVEDDAMNMICLGGRVVDPEFALKLVTIFMASEYIDVERHTRRLAKITELENIEKNI